MFELREFRGYLNGALNYTFPLHWIDRIEVISNNKMKVIYYDDIDEYCENPIEIIVDYIDIK